MKRATPLLCLVVAAALLAACGGTSSSTSNGSAKPPIFHNRDLQGAWVGSLIVDYGAEITTYLVCDPTGYPESGADGSGRDWTVTNTYSYTTVKPDGDFYLSYVVGRELFVLEGRLGRSGTSMSGRYRRLEDGVRVDGGEFAFALSAGPGTFALDDQVAGVWAGSARNADGAEVAVELTLSATGAVLEAKRSSSDLNSSSSSSSVAFADDTVGRLQPFDLGFQDGNLQHFDFALVDLDGQVLEGPGTDSVLGPVRMRLTRP